MDFTIDNNITITNNQIPDYVSQIFGYLGGIMVCIQEVPQFIKIIRTKSTDDLSIIGLILRCISGVIWFIYGFLLMELPILLCNSIYTTLGFIILFFKIHYDKKNKNKNQSKNQSKKQQNKIDSQKESELECLQ